MSSFPQLRSSINTLPQDILLEILSRVPAESILDCKCVSKPWRDLVRHPSLPQRHLNHLNRDLDSGKSSIIFSHDDLQYNTQPYYYTEYDERLNRCSRTARINIKPPMQRSRILGSCNGLIFFMNSKGPFYRPAYICNPITRECILLEKVGGVNWLTGFGYVPSTNEYKIVRIYNCRQYPNFGNVQIYTLGSGIGWRDVRDIKMNYDVKTGTEQGVFANGAVHWVDKEQGIIVAFDLADEEIRVIPSPPCLPQADNPHAIPSIKVLGDLLCAAYKYDGGCDVWVLKKNNNNHQDLIWSKEFSHINTNASLIGLTKSGGLICYDHDDKQVYRYTPKSSSSRMLVDSGDEEVRYGVSHKNSLVSLKALGEEDIKEMESCEIVSRRPINRIRMVI